MPIKKAKIKSKVTAVNQKSQAFDAVEAKRSAMALFSSDLNIYERGPDNKWRRQAAKAES